MNAELANSDDIRSVMTPAKSGSKKEDEKRATSILIRFLLRLAVGLGMFLFFLVVPVDALQAMVYYTTDLCQHDDRISQE
jgi:hypothetical protein